MRTGAILTAGLLGMMLATGAMALTPAPASQANKDRAPAGDGCYVTDGYLFRTKDSGLVLSDYHGQRLAVVKPPYDKRLLLPAVARMLAKARKDTGYPDAMVAGTYTLCPLPGTVPRKAKLRYVRIRAATELAPEEEGMRGD